MSDNPAQGGELPLTVARWGEVEPDARLHIPKEVLLNFDWYVAGKSCAVLIELRPERGSIWIRRGTHLNELAAKRKVLLEEHSDKTEALRRIAMSQLLFLEAAIGKTNRRITLPASVLDHLKVGKPAKVLCLAYASRIEILSEERVAALSETTRIDINIQD